MASREVSEASTSIVGFYDDEDDLGRWIKGWMGWRDGKGGERGWPTLLREVPYILYVSLH